MLFDANAAKRLAPGAHMVIDGCPGLRLVANATRRTWTYRYKNDAGRMKQVALGYWPELSLQKAVAAWQGVRDQRDDGADPAADKRQARAIAQGPAIESVEQLLEQFLDRYIDAERQAGSAGWARSALERLAQDDPQLAACPVGGVTRAKAYEVIESRKEFPAAAAKLRALLGQAWDWGRDAGLIDPELPNHWRDVMRGRLRSKGKVIEGEHQGKVLRTLSDEELRQLLPWSLEHMHTNGRDATILYLWTGLRGVEIFGLRPEFITQESKHWWITFPARLLKTERHADTVDHRVPLVGRALEVVKKRMERVGPTGYLFETARGGEPMHYSRSAFSSYVYSLQSYSKKVQRRSSVGLVAPVSGWSAHDLRRTARTVLSRLKCPRETAEAFIGHKPEGIVGVYDRHTYDDEKLEWAPRLAQHMEELVSKK